MERQKQSRPAGSRVLGCVLVATITFASSQSTLAAEPVAVFVEDGHSMPVAHLDKLSPPLTEGLRAILAMYALQKGTGCGFNPDDSKHSYCTLNAALKLGPQQCSDAQLQLVGAWFKSVPKMSADATDRNKYVDIQRPGSLKELCVAIPDDGEGNAEIWTKISVTQDGGKILVDAEGTSANEDASTNFRYITHYEIKDHSVTMLSHDVKTKEIAMPH